MNAISVPKTPSQNRLEGFALTALLQGFPIYAMAVLMLKLIGAHEIVGERWGAAIFVGVTSILHGMLMPSLARRFPRQNAYDPGFFDPSLSFSEKIAQWYAKPMVAVQLVWIVLMMSLLSVGVASIR